MSIVYLIFTPFFSKETLLDAYNLHQVAKETVKSRRYACGA
jgi:hypothetical protein